MSYRVPDTDLALSASRSDDRTTLSLTCVPDDSAPLLGPQGFVRGEELLKKVAHQVAVADGDAPPPLE